MRWSFAFLALLAGATTPVAAQELTIGLSAPLSDTYARLGEQWAQGARIAATQDASLTLVEADDACSQEGGRQAAERLVANNVDMVIGFLCTPAIEAAMPILSHAGIPVITPVRTASLTDQKEETGWPIFRLAPRANDESEAVADILVDRWRDQFFAIVDDGTIYGRDLANSLRAAAELAELEPVFLDTFRPQSDNQIGLVGRLRRAGATHVFVGGERSDIAIMARDAAKIGYNVTLAGGEALRSAEEAVPLAEGVLMVGLPEWRDLATTEALEAIRQQEIVPEGYVLPGYAALQIAAQALRMVEDRDLTIAEALRENSFDTAIGSIDFDDQGDLSDNPYRLFRYDGTAFVEVE